MSLPGVFTAMKKDGTIYYRSSITYQNKHISLGSFSKEIDAHLAYKAADRILSGDSVSFIPNIEDYDSKKIVLEFSKWVMLRNLKDNSIYCRNPIYLQKNFFLYYVTDHLILKFDTDDLFYYMKHAIMQRGGHLFVCEYGMQVNIMSRYGIRNFSVPGRDYRFVNGDSTDFRYHNIQIINRYYGVSKSIDHGFITYVAKIHINGDYIIGRYSSEIEAAIAYNKAAAFLKSIGISKDFPENFVESIDEITYAKIFNQVRLSSKIRTLSAVSNSN